MAPHSRRFNPNARRLKKRILKRDARLLDADIGDVDDRAEDALIDPVFPEPRTDGFPTDRDLQRSSEYAQSDAGFFSMVFGLFKRKEKLRPEERGAPAPSDDPVRRVLACPRGAARLDAFAETLRELAAGTPGQRSVALAFHRELTSMASEANVDLAVLSSRVDACADALVDAGERERAGELLMMAGQGERAAQLFVEAGAIEKLDEAHFAMAMSQTSGSLDARLAADRFETLLSVGRRNEAILVLTRARAAFPNNAALVAAERNYRARVIGGGPFAFDVEGGVVVVDRRFPIVLGRGEDTALPLASPVISRVHAEIIDEDGRFRLVARTPRAKLLVDDVAASERTLGERGTLSLDGLQLTYAILDDVLTLRPTARGPENLLVVPLGSSVTLPAPFAVSIDFAMDGTPNLRPSEGTRQNGDVVRTSMPLFVDDVIQVGTFSGRVARGRGKRG